MKSMRRLLEYWCVTPHRRLPTLKNSHQGMLHDSKVTEDKEQFGSSRGVGRLGVFWTGRTGMAWLYSAIFPFLSVLPLSSDKHSRTPLRFVQLCGETKDRSNLNGLYWTWKSEALIKHELVSFLPYMYCSIPPFPHRLSFSPCIFCKSRRGFYSSS